MCGPVAPLMSVVRRSSSWICERDGVVAVDSIEFFGRTLQLGRDVAFRWDDLMIDGFHFRVLVTPVTTHVDWTDCPSKYLPSGYSAGRMIPVDADLSALFAALPTMALRSQAEIAEEVADWFYDLNDDEDYQFGWWEPGYTDH